MIYTHLHEPYQDKSQSGRRQLDSITFMLKVEQIWLSWIEKCK